MDFPQFALLTGAFAILGSIWNYIKLVLGWVASIAVVHNSVENIGATALYIYFNDHLKQTDLGSRRYNGSEVSVKTARRPQLVMWKLFNMDGALFWKGRRPVWLGWQKDKSQSEAMNLSATPHKVTIAFVRGTFNIDQLLIDVAAYYNGVSMNVSRKSGGRHFIKRETGINERRAYAMGNQKSSPDSIMPAGGSILEEMRSATPIGIARELIGVQRNDTKMKMLALSDDAERAVDAVRLWHSREEWYRERGVPWRVSLGLYGPPGTGKTSLVRAIAEELDMPIFSFNLASLASDELEEAWRNMMTYTPCIALIEDLHAVFRERENITQGTLTFDTLLNVIQGIERNDGIALVVTTNDLSTLAVELGKPLAGSFESTRPGRIEHFVYMGPLDQAGRMKLAMRILMDWPELWNGIVVDGRDMTGDQFQALCFEVACARLRESFKTNGRVHVSS